MAKGKLLHATDESNQCQAVTLETRWKRDKKVDLRCPFVAKLSFDKKRLCNKHAQCEALALLVISGVATVIPIPQARTPYQIVATVKEQP